MCACVSQKVSTWHGESELTGAGGRGEHRRQHATYTASCKGRPTTPCLPHEGATLMGLATRLGGGKARLPSPAIVAPSLLSISACLGRRGRGELGKEGGRVFARRSESSLFLAGRYRLICFAASPFLAGLSRLLRLRFFFSFFFFLFFTASLFLGKVSSSPV